MPDSVKITDAGDMRLSPNDMRELKAATGRKLTELTGEQADEADAMQTMAWLHLRRAGNPVPWELLGDVAIEFEVEAEPDPTSDSALADLAGFCRFWGFTPREVDALTDAEYRAFVDLRESRDSGGKSGCSKEVARWLAIPRSSSSTAATRRG